MGQQQSVSSSGASGDESSWLPSISEDGRFVVFTSEAGNLVAHQPDHRPEVFVRDRRRGVTRLVSRALRNGYYPNGNSYEPQITADGRLVAFSSEASNLVPGDRGRGSDVFVRDLRTATTHLVSVSKAGTQSDGSSSGPSISDDGRYVAFTSTGANLASDDLNIASDIFVRDRSTGRTTAVSRSSAGALGNARSYAPSISANGRFVAFASDASNLVRHDDNGTTDIFLRDLLTGTTRLISRTEAGPPSGQRNKPEGRLAVSPNGRLVAFDSEATDLVAGDDNADANHSGRDVFLRDTRANSTARISVDAIGQDSLGSSQVGDLTADGRFLTFTSTAPLVAGDEADSLDLFERDLVAGSITRVTPDTGYGAAYARAGDLLALVHWSDPCCRQGQVYVARRLPAP
ncbi:MAG: PD40 domain-containing protein [Acidimicrobiales bacterium]|nr:PD40 domain-containing protein [Acidimicrobiales bacterium]